MPRKTEAAGMKGFVAGIKELDGLSFLLQRPDNRRIDRVPFQIANVFNTLYLVKNVLTWHWYAPTSKFPALCRLLQPLPINETWLAEALLNNHEDCRNWRLRARTFPLLLTDACAGRSGVRQNCSCPFSSVFLLQMA